MPPEEVDYKFFRLFRILFGLCLADSVLEDFVAGFHQYALLERGFHFHYWGFGWMEPLSEPFFSGCYLLLICSALLFSAGYLWRITSILNFLLYGYIHFLEKADYNNHYYFILILCFFFCLHPVENAKEGEAPQGPAWFLDLFRYQFAIVYFFAGLAKWNRDWLLGEPLTDWMEPLSRYYHAPWLADPYFGGFMAISGLLIDLLAGPALLHPRTRNFAVVGLIGFHSCNELFFQIGVFPALMVSSCLLFLGPITRSAGTWKGKRAKWMALFLGLQLLLPLRHYLLPGLTNWTEDGHRYAWRMKLRSKNAKLHHLIVDGKAVNALNYLSQFQIKRMASRPDMICQFAHYLKQEHGATSVRMLITAGLNGRPLQTFVDPDTELTQVQVSPFSPTTWIEPLANPYLAKDPKYTRRAVVAILYSLALFQFILGTLSKRRKELLGWTVGQLLLSAATLSLFSQMKFAKVGILGVGFAMLWTWIWRKKEREFLWLPCLTVETVCGALLISLYILYH